MKNTLLAIFIFSFTQILLGESIDDLFDFYEKSIDRPDNIGDIAIDVFSPLKPVLYTCPSCSKDTEYTLTPYNDKTKEKIDSYSDILYLESYKRRIYVLNRVSEKFHLKFSLSEKEFCSKCTKNSNSKSFYLIGYNENKKIFSSKLESPNDITKLISFFVKDLTWSEYFHDIRSLKKEIPRIKVLLGINKIDPNVKQNNAEILSPIKKAILSEGDMRYLENCVIEQKECKYIHFYAEYFRSNNSKKGLPTFHNNPQQK